MPTPSPAALRGLALALLLPLAACGSDEPPVEVQGVDPVQSDGDLTPDATMAPESEQAPAGELEPETELEPAPVTEPPNE